MEPARTNRCTQSEDFTQWTNNATGTTVTANAITAPDGMLTADLIAGDGSTTVQGKFRTVVFSPADATPRTKAVSVFLKRGTGNTTVRITVFDSTASAVRYAASVAFTPTGATVTTVTGSGVPFAPDLLTDDWVRVMFSADNVQGANTNSLVISTADSLAQAGSVYAWGAQAEDAAVPSSYIPTVASVVARAADVLFYPANESFSPRTVYARTIERGASASGSSILFGQFLNAGSPAVYLLGGSAGYSVEYSDGVGFATSTVQPSAVFGDVIEIRGIVTATGATQVGVTKNRGAEALGGLSSTLTPSLAIANRLYFGGPPVNPIALTHVALADGEQSLDTMRQLAGVP
jgi:hypothetical protein